jgi:hypothetical protein
MPGLIESTYLILPEVVEQDLHGPVRLVMLAAILGQTSFSEVRSTVTRDLALEVFDLADSVRRGIGGFH